MMNKKAKKPEEAVALSTFGGETSASKYTELSLELPEWLRRSLAEDSAMDMGL